ncbi:RNA polymerase I enhancer binding protein, partial [Kickxella alabastrina]
MSATNEHSSGSDEDWNGDRDGDFAVALGEVLRGYPGLLSRRVEEVARALTQATLAASSVSAQYASATSSTLQRVRLGVAATTASSAASAASAASALAAASPSMHSSAAAAGGDPSGESTVQRQQHMASRRRWFTATHVQQMRVAGVEFKKGKFTDAENAAIEAAVVAFSAMHGVGRPEMYRQLFAKVDEPGGRRLRREFWPVLAEALPLRQVQAIYHHVRRRFHPHNYQGAWTAAEDERLRRLVAEHGPAWEAVGGRMGRMGTNCRDRWR